MALFTLTINNLSPALEHKSGELPQRDASMVRLNNDCRRSKGRKKARPLAAPRARKAAKPKRGKPYLSR